MALLLAACDGLYLLVPQFPPGKMALMTQISVWEGSCVKIRDGNSLAYTHKGEVTFCVHPGTAEQCRALPVGC